MTTSTANTRAWSLDKDRYIHRFEPPPGIAENFKISLDEFMLFDSTLEVNKLPSRVSQPSIISINEACRYIRRKKFGKPASACLSLGISSHEKLNELVALPRFVKDKSFFERFWPSKQHSIYLKHRSKIFYTFWEGYVSRPTIAYGGATEWLYVYSGRLEVTLIKPTDLNLYKHSGLGEDEDEKFEPQAGTEKVLKMRENHFLVIPAGWISVKRALRTTCAYGGELFHSDNLSDQLKAFERDVISSEGRHAYDRDTEIRHLHWFYTIHLLVDPRSLKMSASILECLKHYLETWKNEYKKIEAGKVRYIQPQVFAPQGIQIDAISKDLRRKFWPSVRGKSLKGKKDSVDVTDEQMAVDDEPD